MKYTARIKKPTIPIQTPMTIKFTFFNLRLRTLAAANPHDIVKDTITPNNEPYFDSLY